MADGDAGRLRSDAGANARDAGADPRDAGAPPADAGVPDAGPTPVDAGPARVDAGPAPVDAGPAPVDAGPAPVDAGPAPVDAGPLVVEYLAQGVGCLFLDIPSTDAAFCESVHPAEIQMDLLTNDPGVDSIARGYAIFALDGQVTGHPLLSAEMHVRIGASAGSESDSSAEVWTSEPFTLAGLSTDAPPAPLVKFGDDQGTVVQNQDVVIPLLGTAAGTNLSPALLHFVFVATSGDGVNYVAQGDLRPRLVLTLSR